MVGRKCLGWAYEKCGQPALYTMVEYWANGSWFEHDLCKAHAISVIADVQDETDPPHWRVWRPLLVRFAEGDGNVRAW